jgi:hypothetical protein
MRRSFILASCLILAGCATRPQLPETPAVQSATTREPRGILGMSTTELVGHFGNPALQIREGASSAGEAASSTLISIRKTMCCA